MRLDKILLSFKTISAIFAVVGLICCVVFNRYAQKYIDNNVFYIGPVINDNKNYISADDVKSITDTIQSESESVSSYESRKDGIICFDKNQVYTNISAVGTEYFSINNIKFADGGSWISKDVHQNVIVINESLAWRLYGNTKVTGAKLSVSGKTYIVIGIVKQNKLSKYDCMAWAPLPPDDYSDKIISTAFIKTHSYMPVNSLKNIMEWLNTHKEGSYYVTSIDMYKQSIELRYKLLLWVLYVYAALYLTHRTYLFFKASRGTVISLPYLTAAVLINIIVYTVVYRYVGLEITVLRFSGTAMEQIFQALFNWKLLPPVSYLSGNVLELSRLNGYANIAFGLGLAGIFSFIREG